MRGRLRERTPGVWEISVELGRDPLTGKRRQLSKSCRGGRRDAEALLNSTLAEVQRGMQTPSNARLDQLLERWLEQAATDLSPTTLRRYRGLVDGTIVPALGQRPLAKLTAGELDGLYMALLQRRKLAPATVRQVHAIIRRALAQGVRWGWLTSNPAINASPPRVHRPDITPPTPDEVLLLIGTADAVDPEFATFLRLSAATGARRGEVCALRWPDVSATSQSILIARSIVETADGLLEKATKTHSARRVSLDSTTLATLQAHRIRMDSRAIDAGTVLLAGSYVFSASPDGGRPWTPDRVTKAFIRLCRTTGLKGVRLHDLRHFAATRLLAAGVPVRTVSGRLGHTNSATTLNVYAHFLEESDEAAATVMGRLLG